MNMIKTGIFTPTLARLLFTIQVLANINNIDTLTLFHFTKRVWILFKYTFLRKLQF